MKQTIRSVITARSGCLDGTDRELGRKMQMTAPSFPFSYKLPHYDNTMYINTHASSLTTLLAAEPIIAVQPVDTNTVLHVSLLGTCLCLAG